MRELLDRAAALVAGGRGLVGDLVRELWRSVPGGAGIRLDQVGGLEAAGRPGGRVAGQLEGERLAGQRLRCASGASMALVTRFSV